MYHTYIQPYKSAIKTNTYIQPYIQPYKCSQTTNGRTMYLPLSARTATHLPNNGVHRQHFGPHTGLHSVLFTHDK